MRTIKAALVLTALTLVAVAADVQTYPACDTRFTVNQNDFVDYPFSPIQGAQNVHLSGDFTATGGAKNLIWVLVANDDQYREWQQKRADARTLYGSGWVSHGSIDLTVPDDANYHVVFSNLTAPYAKSVEANLKWQWTLAAQHDRQ
jgi:hypothetical protein